MTKPSTTEDLEAALGRIKAYARPRRRRLLVIEDNPAEQLSISELLGHADIDVVTVGSGAEALAHKGKGSAGTPMLTVLVQGRRGVILAASGLPDQARHAMPLIVNPNTSV